MTSERTGGRFDVVRKDALASRAGVRYRDSRRTLTPRFGLVWRHLLAGHASLVLAGALVVTLGRRSPGLRVPLLLAGAVLLGYALAYINLFLHEAAHYNLAPTRRWNDRLANLVIGSLSGEDVREYRPRHFEHHRRLGQPDDTEHSYFDPLDMRFVAESLLGVRALQSSRVVRSGPGTARARASRRRARGSASV